MRKWLTFFVVLFLLILALSVAAQSGYDLPWWDISGGGGLSAEADFSLAGTIGQADGGPTMSGGNYIVIGGFGSAELAPVSFGEPYIYLPVITSR
ncbi:MAG: hypothetical protein PVH18_12650 [Chloroflexota bacterium]|jgi:hypothetical protein